MTLISMPSSYRIIRLLTLLAVLSLLSCTTTVAENRGVGQFAELDAERQGSASSPFWDHWGDGKAELTSYKGRIARYGELREATAVLIYVTEPTHRESWIKDDDAQGVDRVDVLKLNHTISFSTGIYPYSVMTSTFSPVDDWGRERFFPAKINLSVQEWCGHVFQGLWPGRDETLHRLHSYFESEGDREDILPFGEGVLYEDALPIQLRELDGPFASGGDWSGKILPTLWHHRMRHVPLEAVDATIGREPVEIDGDSVIRFTVRYLDVIVTYDIEDTPPRRLLGWEHSDGTQFRLHKTARLPYWQLNQPGHERYLEEIGLGSSE